MIAEDPGLRGKESTVRHRTVHSINDVRFIAAAARILAPKKELNGPYVACVATYGEQGDMERVVVSIVDSRRRLVIDHKLWLISEYSDEESAEDIMDEVTNDMMDYCQRSRVGKVFVVDKPFPLRELEEKCPNCGEKKLRVPWPDR